MFIGRLMVVARAVDTCAVIHRVLVTVAWICCGLVIASFALFVRDQLKSGSNHQVQLLNNTAPTAPAKASRPPGQPKRFIDAAAHDLTSPFDAIVSSDSPWINHMIPDFFALLVYGGGLGFLARYTSGRAHQAAATW
jgi:hypothetical protein